MNTKIQSSEIACPDCGGREIRHEYDSLQYIYTDKDVNEQVLSLSKAVICTKLPTGRPGMDLWSIFVLANVRHS